MTEQLVIYEFTCLTSNELLSVQIVYYDNILLFTFCNFWTFKVKTGCRVRGRINKELSLSVSGRVLQTAEQKNLLLQNVRFTVEWATASQTAAESVAAGEKSRLLLM